MASVSLTVISRLPPVWATAAASISGFEGDVGDGAEIQLDVRGRRPIAVAPHLDVVRPRVERQRLRQRRPAAVGAVDEDGGVRQ